MPKYSKSAAQHKAFIRRIEFGSLTRGGRHIMRVGIHVWTLVTMAVVPVCHAAEGTAATRAVHRTAGESRGVRSELDDVAEQVD